MKRTTVRLSRLLSTMATQFHVANKSEPPSARQPNSGPRLYVGWDYPIMSAFPSFVLYDAPVDL